jgi:hypothetical protein
VLEQSQSRQTDITGGKALGAAVITRERVVAIGRLRPCRVASDGSETARLDAG